MEDLIAVYFATGQGITLRIIGIITLVAIPFAAFGELVVDKVDLPILNRKAEIFLEFFVFGLLMGITEDAIAIFASTGEQITLRIILISAFVALPFAAFSELIVDRIDFSNSRES